MSNQHFDMLLLIKKTSSKR